MYLVQKSVKQLLAATKIQKAWRGYKSKEWFRKLKADLVVFQAHCRGFKIRQMIAVGQYNRKAQVIINKKNYNILLKEIKYFLCLFKAIKMAPPQIEVKKISSDEAFVSKESSQEELRVGPLDKKVIDSDE